MSEPSPFQPCCLLSLAPPSTLRPEGSWLLLLQVRQEKLEGNPRGSAGKDARLQLRGVRACGRRAQPRAEYGRPRGSAPPLVPPNPPRFPPLPPFASRAAGGATSRWAPSAPSPRRARPRPAPGLPLRPPARPRPARPAAPPAPCHPGAITRPRRGAGGEGEEEPREGPGWGER